MGEIFETEEKLWMVLWSFQLNLKSEIMDLVKTMLLKTVDLKSKWDFRSTFNITIISKTNYIIKSAILDNVEIIGI